MIRACLIVSILVISFSSILTRPPVVLACMCMLDHEEAWKNVREQRIIHGKLNYILVQVRCLCLDDLHLRESSQVAHAMWCPRQHCSLTDSLESTKKVTYHDAYPYWSVRFESSQSFSRIIAAGCVGLALVGTRFVAHFRVVSLFYLNWKVNTSNTRAIWMWFLLYFFLWY